MNQPTRYATIARDATARIEVKKSVFLARVCRVEDEPAARDLVDAARKEHWDARHHCSAFVLGPDAQIQRSNDDGEPAGTAGMPMLEVVRGAGLSDVAAVVTRWFGGTLLGAGGLVRAYGDAVRAALDEAGTLERRLLQEASLEVSHADAGRIEHDLRARGVVVTGVEYAQAATVQMAVPPDTLDDLHAAVAALTSGAGEVVLGGHQWVDG